MLPYATHQSAWIADIVVYDRTGRRVLIAEVKASRIEEPEAVIEYVRGRAGSVEYWLLVDPEEIRLYRGSAGRPQAISVLPTRGVLSHYDAEYTKSRIFEWYLTTLTEAWLRDLADHWKFAEPPGAAELQDTGLLDRLAGGTTETEAPTSGDAIR